MDKEITFEEMQIDAIQMISALEKNKNSERFLLKMKGYCDALQDISSIKREKQLMVKNVWYISIKSNRTIYKINKLVKEVVTLPRKREPLKVKSFINVKNEDGTVTPVLVKDVDGIVKPEYQDLWDELGKSIHIKQAKIYAARYGLELEIVENK